MLKKLKENKKLQIILVVVIVFIVGIVIALTIIGIKDDQKYLNKSNQNIENNNDKEKDDCKYNTGNSEDDEALKKLCEKDGVRREIITNINNVKGLKKEELEKFINLLIDNGAVESINMLSVLTISDIYYAKKITSNCYSSDVIDELSNMLFNKKLKNYNNVDLDKYFTKVNGYYCSNEVIPGNAGYDYKLDKKEEKDNTITYNYSGEAIAGEENTEYGAVAIKFKLINERYVIDDINNCSYNLDNLSYNKELSNYCQKTGLNFPAVLKTEELVKHGYGFEKNLRLNNLNDLRQISDKIIDWWDKKTYFSSVKELDQDLKERFFLTYIMNGCTCIHKDVIKENYEHLFGEDVDYKIFNNYDNNSITDNFICTCYGSGTVGAFKYIKEEKNNNIVSYYYNVVGYEHEDELDTKSDVAKITFKLNNGYYNLISIEKAN